jgi:Fe-S cluster assembly ATP-binding protein
MKAEVNNIYVSVGDKQIVKGISFAMQGGEMHIIMGPNGSGKSTLSSAIAGHPSYKVNGQVNLNGHNILDMSPDERAKRGVFLSFQNPPAIEGVSILQLLKKAYVARHGLDERNISIYKDLNDKLSKALDILGLDKSFISREINKNFSGGEKKKVEILTMLIMEPSLAIIDEVDSGLDVDALKTVSKAINSLKSQGRAFLIITHYNRILKYVDPTHVHIMKDGKIIREGGKELALEIEEKGYNDQY